MEKRPASAEGCGAPVFSSQFVNQYRLDINLFSEWIRIEGIRIHKIWWIRIRIQVNKIIKLIWTPLLKVKKTDLKNIFPTKKYPQILLVNLSFPLIFPSGSKSLTLFYFLSKHMK